MIVFAALTAFFVIVVAILAIIYVPIIHDKYRRYNIDLTDDRVSHCSIGVIRKLYKQGFLKLDTCRVKYWSIDNIVTDCKRDAFVYKSKDGIEYIIYPDSIVCCAYFMLLMKVELVFHKNNKKHNLKRKYAQESERLLRAIIKDIQEEQRIANEKIIEAKNDSFKAFQALQTG